MTFQHLQWVHFRLVQNGVASDLGGPNGFTWSSELWPYTVPADKWLGITYASLSSKFVDGGAAARGSLLVITNVLTVPDNYGDLKPPRPIVVPPNATITAQLINNDDEPQWMGSIVMGVLAPYTAGQSYWDAFAGYTA